MIVLVRHGQTEANRAGRLLGRADPSLNERGRHQAGALATVLEHGPPLASFSRARSSARETAEQISAATGTSVRIDERLLELDYGEWDERPLRDIPADVGARWRSDPSFAAPGESLVDLRLRITPCAEEPWSWRPMA